MLLSAQGETFGTVSGGCLETDVLERAKQVFRTGKSQIFTYDTRADKNSVSSLNMGCRGVIRILLESVGKESRLLDAIRRAAGQRIPQVVATLIAIDAANDAPLGVRIFCDETGRFDTDSLPEFLSRLRQLTNDCLAMLDKDITFESRIYATERGSFEFALETIAPPVAVNVFGAGADAIPLTEIGASLGWQITVFDHRPAYLNAGRFPQAQNLVLYNRENLADKIKTDNRTAAVLITHNYDRDREILRHLLKSAAFYVGALGPRRRTENLLQDLSDAGEHFDVEELKKLFAPVGLNIGESAPESIALSIAAEIEAVLNGESAGFLRDKTSSIYNRKDD